MPGPRAVQHLQMPHPRDWLGGQMPRSCPGWGWAQVELTDALHEISDWICVKTSGSFLKNSSDFKHCFGLEVGATVEPGHKKLTCSWPVQLETAISSFSRFRFLSTLIVKLVLFSRSAVQVYRSKFFLAVHPWLPSVRSFWQAVQPLRTIRSLFYSCRSAVQVYHSEIFLAVQTWLPSIRNFSLAVQPSYQSVRNKLSAVQPFGFIRSKRLRGPFLTRSTAVRFTCLTESR